MCWPIRGVVMLTVDPWGPPLVRVFTPHHDNQPGTDNEAKQRLISVTFPTRNYNVKLQSVYSVIALRSIQYQYSDTRHRQWWLCYSLSDVSCVASLMCECDMSQLSRSVTNMSRDLSWHLLISRVTTSVPQNSHKHPRKIPKILEKTKTCLL